MTELIITSSVLILVVISMRHFLKGKISLRLQYALWALVLVRLLVPINFAESPVSVLNALEAAASIREEWTSGSVPTPASTPSSALGDTETALSPDAAIQAGPDNIRNVRHDIFDWTKLLLYIWYSGIGIVGLCLLFSNLSFGRKLRKTRKKYQADNCKLLVYEAEALPSPCLFGVVRPAIYITPDVARDETKLRHVLAHELTHYCHGDHIWSALRSLCIAIHWYNPLVWLAAVLSRRDAELACDEATIKILGEAHRMEYGRMLIGLTCEKRSAMDLLSCATTMTVSKREIRERILLIAKKPRMLVPALIAVLLVAVAAAACTFTGAKNEAEISPLTAEEVEQYNKTFRMTSWQDISMGMAREDVHKIMGEPDGMLSGMLGDIYMLGDGSRVIFYYDSEKTIQSIKRPDAGETYTNDLDEAVKFTLLQKNQGRYYRGECIGEGHIILGHNEESGIATVYALTMYGEYGFENRNFVKVSGSGIIPVVFTFMNSENGLVCTKMEDPEDGARYGDSIRRLFPPEYLDRALSPTNSDLQDLKSQEREYAASYLKEIGRDAVIGDYGDFEHTLLTDVGVSVEVSNSINDKQFANYPMWIGNREVLENEIRYVYEMSYHEEEHEIVFKKYEYDTNKIVEFTRLDSDTGLQLNN